MPRPSAQWGGSRSVDTKSRVAAFPWPSKTVHCPEYSSYPIIGSRSFAADSPCSQLSDLAKSYPNSSSRDQSQRFQLPPLDQSQRSISGALETNA